MPEVEATTAAPEVEATTAVPEVEAAVDNFNEPFDEAAFERDTAEFEAVR